MGVNRERQAIEWAHCIDTGRADLGLPVSRVPQLQIATASLGAISSELEFCNPFRIRYTRHMSAQLHQCLEHCLVNTYGLWAHKDPLVWPG